MLASAITAVCGAVLGATVGALLGQLRIEDSGSVGQAGMGVCMVLGTGLGAVAGAVIGGTAAVVDAIHRRRPPA